MPNASDVLTLPAILKMHMGSLLLGENSGRLLPMLTADEVSKGLLQFAEIVQLRAGEDLYRVGEQADAMYIILSGEVVCDWDLESFSRCATVNTCFYYFCPHIGVCVLVPVYTTHCCKVVHVWIWTQLLLKICFL